MLPPPPPPPHVSIQFQWIMQKMKKKKKKGSFGSYLLNRLIQTSQWTNESMSCMDVLSHRLQEKIKTKNKHKNQTHTCSTLLKGCLYSLRTLLCPLSLCSPHPATSVKLVAPALTTTRLSPWSRGAGLQHYSNSRFINKSFLTWRSKSLTSSVLLLLFKIPHPSARLIFLELNGQRSQQPLFQRCRMTRKVHSSAQVTISDVICPNLKPNTYKRNPILSDKEIKELWVSAIM